MSSGTCLDICSLLAFRTLRDVKIDFLTFFEGLKTIHVDCREVCKQIFAAVLGRNKAEALGVIEPFNSTSCHESVFQKEPITRAVKARSFAQSCPLLSPAPQPSIHANGIN